MAGPPDFIEPFDLVVDVGRPEDATWPESSTLPQRAIKLILDAGFAYYGVEGQQFALRRALPFLEEEERAKVEQLLREKPPNVIHAYARQGAQFPTVAIVLDGESQPAQELFLGDYATVGLDNYGDAGYGSADVFSVGFDTTLRLVLYDDNADVVIYWYELVKFVLIQSREILSRMGLDIPYLKGTKIRALPKFQPELVYSRDLLLRLRTRQVFATEAELIDHLDAFVKAKFTAANTGFLQVDGAFVGESE